MTHHLSTKLVKYIYLLLIHIIIIITIVPFELLLFNGKCNVASATTVIGMKETLQTFKVSGCLISPLQVKCPEATVIDIISARYGALAPNSTEERDCLNSPLPDLESSGVTAASAGPSTTQARRTSPYYTLFNDYLDDISSESPHSIATRNKGMARAGGGGGGRGQLRSHRLRHHHSNHKNSRKKRTVNYEEDNCQGHVEIKDLLQSVCRSHQKCVFSPESDELSSISICNSTNGDIYSDLRFMEVEFRCGPRTRSQSLLCEGDTFTAECAPGQRIVVFDGYFGMLEKEKSSLISLGSLPASTSCDRFAKRFQEKRKELMLIQKYELDQDGTLVDPLGRRADPWFQLTTCRTTSVKSFLMDRCHGRSSCTFDVTKETLWLNTSKDLLSNCKKGTSDYSRLQMNRLKVEYTCADRTIFSTMPASLVTSANDLTDKHLSTVSILIDGSTSPAQDYPYVSLTPKPTTLMWPSRVRTTSSKPPTPAEAVLNETDSRRVAPGDDDDDDDLRGYSNSPTVATTSLDTDSSDDTVSSEGDMQVSAITIMSEASSGEQDKSPDTSRNQGAMRTSSSLPSLTETPGNTSPSDTGLANCTIPPLSGNVQDAEGSTGRSFFIIPVNNLLSAYSFVINNLEKFILYFLLAFLASLLAVLILLSCRLYFSKRHIVRRHKKIASSSPPVNVLMDQVDEDEDEDDDDDDDDTHHQLTPSPDTHYSSHRAHHRFSSPTTVDGNTTVASNASLRSHSGNSHGGGSLGVRLSAAPPLDNLTHSSPNLTPRAATSTPSCRSDKFISPAARIYFENQCKIHGTLSRNRSGLADSGASLGQGEDTDAHNSRASPITPPPQKCDDSPNLLVGSYRTSGTRDVNSSGDSGNSIAADHESSSSDNHVAPESHLRFADDERCLNESSTSDPPTTRGPVGTQIDPTRGGEGGGGRESMVSGHQPSQYFLRTFSRHPQGVHTTYSSPYTVHHHRLNAYPTSAVSSSTGARSLVTTQSCTSESTPLLTHIDSRSSGSNCAHTGTSATPVTAAPAAAAAAAAPDASLPMRHSVLHSYSFVHHPHHLNHHQHPNADYYAYHQTEM